MKPVTIAKNRGAALVITYKTLIKLMSMALILSITTKAGAALKAISFNDGGNNVGSGVIDVEGGYAVSGDFVVTVGLASGDWTLAGGTPSSAGSGISPNGYFNYDNMVFLDSDPFLTATGGLLFTNSLGDLLNIWADAPDTYCMWAVNSTGDYYVEAGSYPGFSGATGFGTTTITNAPSAPMLSIQPMANGIMLSWPASGSVFRLLQNSDCTSTNWCANTNAISLVNGTNQVTVTPACGIMLFRLINP
jgi:hypothetical protein